MVNYDTDPRFILLVIIFFYNHAMHMNWHHVLQFLVIFN